MIANLNKRNVKRVKILAFQHQMIVKYQIKVTLRKA